MFCFGPRCLRNLFPYFPLPAGVKRFPTTANNQEVTKDKIMECLKGHAPALRRAGISLCFSVFCFLLWKSIQIDTGRKQLSRMATGKGLMLGTCMTRTPRKTGSWEAGHGSPPLGSSHRFCHCGLLFTYIPADDKYLYLGISGTALNSNNTQHFRNAAQGQKDTSVWSVMGSIPAPHGPMSISGSRNKERNYSIGQSVHSQTSPSLEITNPTKWGVVGIFCFVNLPAGKFLRHDDQW